MVIAVDIDGVLADLQTELLRRYNADYNDHLALKDITAWDFKNFVKPECGEHVYEYFDAPGLYNNVCVIRGAIGGVEALRANHRVIFVTTPTPKSAGAKLTWLSENGLLDNKKNYMECYDKSLVRADVLVDDGAHNLMNFKKDRILFHQPWNANDFVGGSYRARSWEDVVNFVKIINSQNHPYLNSLGIR